MTWALRRDLVATTVCADGTRVGSRIIT